MIKAIIFDLGGVLVRTEDRRPRTMLADAMGKTYAELEYLIFNSESGRAGQLGKLTWEENLENARHTLGLKPDEMAYLQMAFFGGDILDIELANYIRSLRPRYKIGLLSNNFGQVRQELASRWHIADLFDDLVISAEHGILKPNPRIYLLALERLGVQPAEAVFVDDFAHNIQGALAVGMHGLVFHNRAQLIEQLNALLEEHSR